MPTLVSPGVQLQEVDKTFVNPGIDPSGMAVIGPTARGPLEIPTGINNYQEFKDIFGTVIRSGSQAYELYTNLAVKNYFDNGGASALVVRVAPDASTFAAASSSLITSVSSYYGYHASGGAINVGKASTKAVVYSSIIILIFNYILTDLILSGISFW